MKGLLWTGVLALCAAVTFAIDCSTFQSCDPKKRRILFILDASASIGDARFNSDLLDFVLTTYCGVSSNTNDGAIQYQAGAVVFNRVTQTYIPFQNFTADEFEAAVNSQIRNRVTTSCCTPHAEAVRLARHMFSDPTLEEGYENIAFIVTDGQPSPNLYNQVTTDPIARKFYEDFNIDILNWTLNSRDDMTQQEKTVFYATHVLPEQVKLLIEQDVRLFFTGVPSINGAEVNIGYFNGSDTEFCFGGVCADMEYTPLVSLPASEHAFAVETWDLNPLIEISLEKICRTWSGRIGACNSAQPPPSENANNCMRQDLASFSVCCPGAFDLTRNAKESCREVVTGGPWCSGGPRCRSFTSRDVLNIYLSFETNDAQASCCKQCQVFGDPRGVSFSGAEDDWVICDGRHADSCIVDPQICSSKTDHTGGTCQWSNYRERKIRNHLPDISTYGSPCHPDFSNSRPSMTVYSADDFVASVEMSERGTIYSLTLELSDDTYYLEAEECMRKAVRNPAGAWGKTSIPDTFFVKDWWRNGRTNEIVWQIGDEHTGIMLEVVCVQDASIRNGDKDLARLNIRNVVEMNQNRANPGGFCHTGVIQEADNTLATPLDPTVLQNCMVNQPARLCKALTNPSCNDAEMHTYIDQWCERMQGERVRVKTCKSTIKEAPYPVAMWRVVYCSYAYDQGIVTDVGSCVHALAENPEDTVASHGPFSVSSGYCASSPDDYTPRSENQQCQHGMSVGYEDSDGSFHEVFFIPENYPPCGGKLRIDGSKSKYKHLFNRQLLFRQCESKPSCAMADRCRRLSEFSLSIQYENC